MKVYKLKRDRSSLFLFLLPMASVAVLAIIISLTQAMPPSGLGLLLIIGLSSGCLPFLLTKLIKIRTENQVLYLRMLFYTLQIPFASIRRIEHNNSFMYAGATVKFTLTKNCMIVKYNKYDEILLGIENEEEFLKEVLEGNPALEIKELNS